VIVFGERYIFSDKDIQSVAMSKNDIYYVDDTAKDPQNVIREIKSHFHLPKSEYIILNTDKEVHPAIITFLTHLQYENNITILSIEHFFEKKLQKCYIAERNDDLDFLDAIKSYTKWQYFQKRCIDFFGVFWLFFFSWPVMIYSYFKIKKESPGKIFFKQNRVGRENKNFECIKFRSMHENTDYFNHYTQEDDPRIFPWGAKMRKSRLDELPQMLNILKGEMHLIGPRAEWSELVKDYEQQIPFYTERHLVAPGITGWAQVNYPYGANIEDTRQKLMYDLYYIKYWNIWLELKIVWKTAMTVIKKKGI
jgi:lipopolysaccharide/colanic/teichoic acid biosynthesis glycosyltransferase